MAEFVIRAAVLTDAEVLTEIALRSKAHWGYPTELIALWANDLTVTPASCDGESVWVIERDGQSAGFGEILVEGEVAILDDLWIDPEHIGHGLGGQLLEHLIQIASRRGAIVIEFDAEPHAVGFYERYGAEIIGERVSTLVPGRTLPIMRITLSSTTIGTM